MRLRRKKAAERPSVDWMDFDRADGGPTRRVVDGGVHELPSKRDAPIDAGGDEGAHLR